jgi:hypothetical protein
VQVFIGFDEALLIHLSDKVTDRAPGLNRKIALEVDFWANWLRQAPFFSKKANFAIPPGQNSPFPSIKKQTP